MDGSLVIGPLPTDAHTRDPAPMPGVCVMAGAADYAGCHEPAPHAKADGWCRAWLVGGRGGVSRSPAATVLLDGYVVDARGRVLKGDDAAFLVRQAFERAPDDFPGGLEGSFSGAVILHRERSFLLFSDRLASRPLFYRIGPDGSFVAAPEASWVARWSGRGPEVDEVSVCMFAIFGAQVGASTLFRGVRKLPPATVVEVGPGGARERRYWRLTFEPAGGQAEEALVSQCDERIRAATRRLLLGTGRPFLFLSGGLDSRVILAAALAEGIEPACVCFGTSHGDEMGVAEAVARAAGVGLTRIRLPDEPSAEDVVRAALLGDCQAESVDFPQVIQVYPELAGEFSTFVNGDEAFGWRERAHTVDEARRLVGIFGLREVARLASWLVQDRRRELAERIDARIGEAVGDVREPPNCLKDRLYYEQRIGNMLNAFTYARLRHFEQARPLLAEPVVDFVRRLPDGLRGRKRLLRMLLETRYPRLAEIPYSRADTIPPQASWARAVARDEALRALVRGNLLEDPPPALAALFGTTAFRSFVEAVLDGHPWPAPGGGRWWGRLPLLWRLQARLTVNRVHPISLMMRILQVAIYLKTCPPISIGSSRRGRAVTTGA